MRDNIDDKLEYLDVDSDKMYILGQGSKGNKVLLDGRYTIEDLQHLIELMRGLKK